MLAVNARDARCTKGYSTVCITFVNHSSTFYLNFPYTLIFNLPVSPVPVCLSPYACLCLPDLCLLSLSAYPYLLVFVCLSLSASLSIVCLSLPACLCFPFFVYTCLGLPISACLSLSACLYLSVCLCLPVSVCPTLSACRYPPVSVSACLSLFACFCLPVSVCLSLSA